MKGLMTVAVLATALACTIASPASATITSAGGTSKASLVTTGSSTLTLGSATLVCGIWTFTGTVSGSSASVPFTGTTWGDCTWTIAGLSGAATLTDTSNWTITVTASLGGGSFSASVSTGLLTYTLGPCTVNFPAQTYSGVVWTNTTKSLNVNASGISYTTSGLFCPLPASGTNAISTAVFSEPTITVS